MILFKKSNQLAEYLSRSKFTGKKIGFVPTMGALHKGHLSLLEICRKSNSITVCSIFVNPTQFNDPKDFQKYPVTLERDIELTEKAGTDVLFLPDQAQIYTNGLTQLLHYDLGHLEDSFEGKFRPGHFQGVCQVMHKLLNIVQPDRLYMGQKDYQQCMVVKRLLQLTGANIELVTCPTLREPDGLAMSSRNMRLNENERKSAAAIYRALVYVRDNLKSGSLVDLLDEAKQILTGNCFKSDYVATADATTLAPVDHWDGRQQLIALVAAFMNDVRLIDNMMVTATDERSGFYAASPGRTTVSTSTK